MPVDPAKFKAFQKGLNKALGSDDENEEPSPSPSPADDEDEGDDDSKDKKASSIFMGSGKKSASKILAGGK